MPRLSRCPDFLGQLNVLQDYFGTSAKCVDYTSVVVNLLSASVLTGIKDTTCSLLRKYS